MTASFGEGLRKQVRFFFLLYGRPVSLKCYGHINLNFITWFFKRVGMIKQFLHDVYWQDIDFLVIDTPPGTSDEHITVVELVK